MAGMNRILNKTFSVCFVPFLFSCESCCVVAGKCLLREESPVTGMYEIIKVMNNNVLLARDTEQDQECILIGKGLGFGRQNGNRVTFEPGQVEKRFYAFDSAVRKQYFDLIGGMDSRIVGLCAEVVAAAEEKLGSLSAQIHVVLTDHIGFAIERIRQGMEIHNPFLYEIQMLYPDEFRAAAEGVQYLSSQLDIRIPEDETGFIALHLHAARQNEAVKETLKQTRLLKELVEIIGKESGITVEPGELTYQRLINHLRGVIDRVRKEKSVDNPLVESIRKEFVEAYRIAGLLKNHLEKTYETAVPEGELGYMALHIERLRKMKR